MGNTNEPAKAAALKPIALKQTVKPAVDDSVAKLYKLAGEYEAAISQLKKDNDRLSNLLKQSCELLEKVRDEYLQLGADYESACAELNKLKEDKNGKKEEKEGKKKEANI
jgi:hypothetical protein